MRSAEPAVHEPAYLDHAATTPMTSHARQAWLDAAEYDGNPSSVHHCGAQAREILNKARHDIARCLDCPDKEIVFTSGGTESNTLAIIGRALAATEPHNIVTTTIEHSSLLGATTVAERLGWSIRRIAPGSDGAVDADAVLAAVDEHTALVSVQHANNETGVIQPVADIAAGLRHLGTAAVHSDAVHTVGKLDLGTLPPMMLSLSAHKFGGPRGIGVLRLPGGPDSGTLAGVLRGGGQESGIRAGTENVASAAATATALMDAMEHREQKVRRARDIRHFLTQRFAAVGWQPTSDAPCVETTLSGWFPAVRGDTLLHCLDHRGISISTGSACHSDAHEPSHVLSSMGLPTEQMDNTVRLSFSGEESDEMIHAVAETIVNDVSRLQSLAMM